MTILVATFGAPWWADLAASRAIPSAEAQGVPVVHVHGDTVADARNRAAAAATTEWVIHLDADDELAPGYVDAMGAAAGDLRAPRLTEIHPDGTRTEIILTARNIEWLNPCCIGTAIRREHLLDLGGWPAWPAWEDWALWLTAARRGATIEHVPDAVYLAHVRAGSMNRTVADPAGLHRRIRAAAR